MNDSTLLFDFMKCTGELFFSMRNNHKPMRSLVRGEIFILDYLERKNGTVMPGELSSMTGGSSAHTAISLRNLDQKGYIKREIDKSDRRKIIVSITEEGRKLACEEREAAMQRMSHIIDELGPDDAREYIRIVSRINKINKTVQEG